jgi:hypothetical protein
MVKGDRVRVYPHGSPDAATEATVILLSPNGLSIAVSFMDKPPFAVAKHGVTPIHPEFGVVLLGMREALDGKPWGPWMEIFGGGHYEIEEL